MLMVICLQTMKTEQGADAQGTNSHGRFSDIGGLSPHLGLVKRQNQLLVVEDVALRGEQHVQDLVLDGAQLGLV